MKTPSVSQSELVEKWYLVDATGIRLGKIASTIAEILLGKNDPLTRNYLNPNKKVVVVNCEKLDFTSKKGFTKFYKKYSGYQGGLHVEDMNTKFEKNPTSVIVDAVKGMLPRNKRGVKLLTNLKAYKGSEHAHQAQSPELINVREFKL